MKKEQNNHSSLNKKISKQHKQKIWPLRFISTLSARAAAQFGGSKRRRTKTLKVHL